MQIISKVHFSLKKSLQTKICQDPEVWLCLINVKSDNMIGSKRYVIICPWFMSCLLLSLNLNLKGTNHGQASDNFFVFFK